MQQQTVDRAMGTYVYCVIPAAAKSPEDGPSFSAAPIAKDGEQARVRVLREGDLALVVSEAPLKDYPPSRANVSAHERVVDEALQRGDVLPMRFGTVASDERELQRFLKEKHDDLSRALERIRGKAEAGLKVLWDRDALLAEIIAEDDTIRGLRESVMGRSEAEAYEQRLELGRLTSEAIERKRDAEAERILARLRPRADDVAINRLSSDMMLLNAAFLVKRTDLDAFGREVAALREAAKGRLTLNYVSPLPPYNFVRLSVPKEG